MHTPPFSRRQFLSGVTAASVLGTLGSPAQDAKAPASTRKIKLGLVGGGGRGSWIAGLFQKHGGYEFHAVADYFQEVADRCGMLTMEQLLKENRRLEVNLEGLKA